MLEITLWDNYFSQYIFKIPLKTLEGFSSVHRGQQLPVSTYCKHSRPLLYCVLTNAGCYHGIFVLPIIHKCLLELKYYFFLSNSKTFQRMNDFIECPLFQEFCGTSGYPGCFTAVNTYTCLLKLQSLAL